jgi:hypothetical protein
MIQSTPVQTALLRALAGSLLTGIITLLSTYQVSHSWENAGIVAGLTTASYLMTRGGFEGTVDQKAQQTLMATLPDSVVTSSSSSASSPTPAPSPRASLMGPQA